ncbi:snRNA-activating protein complex subunit 4 [Brachyhypopomus gauderio]|uniref:snRNA-activating protein complex subunit 4 n=1 Tax=Brachyhypopomus gauderio TaxID=698409 RepID=UPI0040427B84
MAQDDLLAERNKIQRQIEALQTSLGADGDIADLLSSQSDSDDTSDDCDSGHARGHVAQDILEAERQQVLQEIKELEQTLGPNAALVDALTDSEHGSGSQMDSSDEDSDDEELYLPQDMETCLQINLVYQEVLKEKLSDLERLLNENRQQQEQIEAHLSGPSSSKQPNPKLFLGNFMKPYFKDKLTGLGPPSNEETRERLSHGKKPCEEMNIRRWNGWHKTLLVDSVVKDTMKRMLQPKMSKVEYLTGKLSKAEDQEKEELKRQIALLQKDIKEISSKKEDQLYGTRRDDHDWEKISNIDFEGLRHSDDLMRFWQNYLHPSINKSAWTQDEIEKLGEIAAQHKCCHWDQIAEALGTNRSAFMCFQTYQRYVSKSFRKKYWTKEEDQVLRDLVEKMRIGNFIPYTQMSYFMEGRDHAQLMYRWTAVLDPSIKRGPWSKEEDQLLLKAVEKFGCKDWYKIRLEVPGRTDNACRDRYLDSLREDVKKGIWSNEEVKLLKSLVEKYGVGKWSKIAAEIPNRVDAQCLNKWRTLTGKAQKKRRVRSHSRGSRRKRRKVMRSYDEDTTDSTSEDENVKVEFLDSDEEQTRDEKLDVLSEEEMDRREEYIQPDMKEWIPAGGNACSRPAGTVRTMLVRLPSEEEEQDCGTGHMVTGSTLTSSDVNRPIPVQNTVLDYLGNPVKTYIGIDPPDLPMWERCNENAMEKVPVGDIQNLLIWIHKNHKRKPIMRRKKTKMSSDKGQKHAKKCRQDTIRKRSNLCGIDGVETKVTNARKSLVYGLLIAVVPWVGNMMMPLPFSEKRVCEADIVRQRAAVVNLQKTSVFLFFLKVLHVDAEGCKKVIEARKASERQSLRPQPESGPQRAVRHNTYSDSPLTVAQILALRALQVNSPKPANIEQPPPPPQPTKQPQQVLQTATQIMGPTLVVPQTCITQSTHLQPVGQGIVPFLQSQNTLEVCQPVLQLAVPVEPQTTVPLTTSSAEVETPKIAPSTSTSTPSTTVPPVTISGEGRTSKRIRRTTKKAQALMENSKSKASKQKNVEDCKGHSEAPTSTLPQTTAWILTPAGLMPLAGIQITPSGTLGNQNQVMPNIVPQVPVIVNQNSSFAFVNTMQPSNPSTVFPAPVAPVTTVMSPSAKTNVGQNLFVSTASNQPRASSLPSINKDPNVSTAITNTHSAPVDTKVPTFLSSSAVRSKISCSQGQPLLSVVPQLTIQSPIIVNQNGSLTLLCDAVPTVPLNSPVTPATSIPIGSSQRSVLSSGLHTTKSFSLPSVSNLNNPSVLPVSPSVLTIPSPVIQRPCPSLPSGQNQIIAYPQVVFQQPVVAKQSISMALNVVDPNITSKPSPSSAAPSKNPPPSATEFPKDLTASSVNNALIESPSYVIKPPSVPSVPSSVALSKISIATSHATQKKNSGSQGSVPVQHGLPVNVRRLPKSQVCANKFVGHTTSSCQTLLKTQAPQVKKQPLQPAAATSNPSPKPHPPHFDPNLMFLEHPDQVQHWIKGTGGISLPFLEDKMPYLPPFVSNVCALASLLQAKETLLNRAAQLLPEEHRSGSGEDDKMAAVRKLVSDRFKTNPAYLLLKARFLSCFTLPALLATIHPCKQSQGDDVSEDDCKDHVRLKIAGSLLCKSEREESEEQFTGFSGGVQNGHHALQR